ncbi:MAG TPA: shikimate kinase [Mobilitalea sp.]|nr:shikimate kinase [Mobilitalea sp.]
MKNIVLIGMPGAGKSTIGVILAKVLGMSFIDSDILIQEQEGRLLKEIIETEGIEGYLTVENLVNCEIAAQNSVIATGGSVVYCSEAMEHLRQIGTVIYIKLSFDTIEERLGCIRQRGVVLREEQNLRSLYDERRPLYEKYAHVIIEGEGLGIEEIMDKITFCIVGNDHYQY